VKDGDFIEMFTGDVPVLTPEQIADGHAVYPQLLYFQGGGCEPNQYPKPDYKQGLRSIATEVGIVAYQNTEVANSFVPVTVAEVKGITEGDEREKIENQFKQIKGPEGSRNVLLFSKDGEADSVKIHPVQDNSRDKKYLEMDRVNTQKILTAHQLPSPVLAGIPGSGSLGGNGTELATAEQLFQNTVINDYQEEISDALTGLLTKGNTGTALIITPRTDTTAIAAA
jgi:hypothetical protein